MYKIHPRIPRIQILLESKHHLVINKPPLIYSQPPSYNTYTGHESVIPTLIKQYPDLSNLFPVQRLDYGVSGAMVIAKSSQAAQKFAKNLAKGGNVGYILRKTYIAILHDIQLNIPQLQTISNNRLKMKDENTGSIIMPLLKAISPSPKFDHKSEEVKQTAITHFKILPNILPKSGSKLRRLAIVSIETGRKHQIRRHFAEGLGIPIFNDIKYYPSTEIELEPTLGTFDTKQIGLHCIKVDTKTGIEEIKSTIAPILYGSGDIWDGFLDENNSLPKEVFQSITKYNL